MGLCGFKIAAIHCPCSRFSKFSPGRFCPVQQSTDASIQPRPALYGGSGTLLACGHDGSVSLTLSLSLLLTFHMDMLYLFGEIHQAQSLDIFCLYVCPCCVENLRCKFDNNLILKTFAYLHYTLIRNRSHSLHK